MKQKVKGINDHGREFKGWGHCYWCHAPMTEADTEQWDPMLCCSGAECGCMGMPTNPPCCIKCSSPKEYTCSVCKDTGIIQYKEITELSDKSWIPWKTRPCRCGKGRDHEAKG